MKSFLPLICACLLCLSSLAAQDRSVSKLVVSSYPAEIDQKLIFRTEVSGSEGSAEYRYNFGDGSKSDWISNRRVSHTYQKEGHYNINVQVRDSAGFLGIKQSKVTVLKKAVLATGNTNSSSVITQAGKNILWTVNSDNDSVSKINRRDRVFEYPLEEGCHPRSIAQASKAEFWVTCQDSDQIIVINRRGKTMHKINLGYGSAPFGILSSPDQKFMYVSNFGSSEILKIQTKRRKIRSRLAVNSTPRALAISQNGRNLFVTRFISPQTHGELYFVKAQRRRLKLKKVIELPGDNTTGDTINSGRGIPNYLSAITISPDGKSAYVTANKVNTLRGVFVDGNDLNTVNTIRAMVATIDLKSKEELFTDRRDIDNSESPSSVVLSPYGDYAFITLQGNNIVAIYDLLKSNNGGTNFSSTLFRLKTGLAPQGLVFNPKNNQLVAQNFMTRDITKFSATEFLQGTSSAFDSENVEVSFTEKLPQEILLGKQIFYNASDEGGPNGTNRMSSEGYISCASCHVDGGDDGRVWDFTGRGEGLRNTTDLRGRSGVKHGRVHWSGNFDEIQDFENDIRNNFGGVGFMSDADFIATADTLGPKKAGLSPELDALAAYVTSLDEQTIPRSPYKKKDGSLTEAAERGKLIFKTLNCSSCHSGANFSDSSLVQPILHDVGTLDLSSGTRLGKTLTGIDTPTLLGAWATPPYLHNGFAETLAEVLETSDVHDLVGVVKESEIDDLHQYLLQLD